METLDWKKLAGSVTPDSSKIPFNENKHLFRKVAFDVFQLKSGPVDPLWILEEDDSGESYLVAQYESDDDNQEDDGLESRGSWSALSDSSGTNVTLLYKNSPIRRLASAEFGFSKEDVHLFREALIEKLASNKDLKDKLLSELNSERRSALLSQFPELA